MKKHWKKIVLVLGIIFLSVAGYLVYLFQFKEYDVADEQVDEITKENYEVELPDGSKIIVDGDGNVIEEGSDGSSADGSKDSSSETAAGTDGNSSEGSSSSNSESGASEGGSTGSTSGTAGTSTSNGGTSSGSSDKASGSGSNSGSTTGNTGSNGSGSSNSGKGSAGGSGNSGSGNSGSDAGSGKVTVAQIKQKYEPSLADIENQANSRINGLVSRAKSEYDSKKANGESISYGYFYNKYMSAATELEGRTDTVFYAVLGSMKKELKANGLAESHADSLVSEYEARKEQRKSDLISKATGL
ncbi:hypothetical protein [Planococcus sp. NCCP-2050]|uniref:hypothetical protein n=1 Tax=Planococcus sp. NCCP-2050 TaxID=2944679 RepID=UPI00203CB228|nr:hypothetical protein [Planococcus sp. NCCP-2050]GKW45345.1 hypothetical protein NCCP2050_10370 [Planococcus sp. NCCP-2050]